MLLTRTKLSRKRNLTPPGIRLREGLMTSPAGQLDTDYVYSPYGAVRAAGNITQPIQWSSEMYDSELGLVYYNYRYYNPLDGRWTRRDPIGIEGGVNLYGYVGNTPIETNDQLGDIFSQNQDTCCLKCEEYIRLKKEAYARKIQEIEDMGCSLVFECKNFSRALGVAGWLSWRKRIIRIRISCKEAAQQAQDSYRDTFGHELTHAYDRCHGDIGFGSESIIRTEVRAYLVGGCKGRPTEEDTKKCLYGAVRGSLAWYWHAYLRNETIDKIIDKYYEMYK